MHSLASAPFILVVLAVITTLLPRVPVIVPLLLVEVAMLISFVLR